MINHKTLFFFLLVRLSPFFPQKQSREAKPENKRGKEIDNNNCWNKSELLGKAA
jgi:hypothetical protein